MTTKTQINNDLSTVYTIQKVKKRKKCCMFSQSSKCPGGSFSLTDTTLLISALISVSLLHCSFVLVFSPRSANLRRGCAENCGVELPDTFYSCFNGHLIHLIFFFFRDSFSPKAASVSDVFVKFHKLSFGELLRSDSTSHSDLFTATHVKGSPLGNLFLFFFFWQKEKYYCRNMVEGPTNDPVTS